MYTLTDIILERKQSEHNSKPKRQLITRANSFYRDPEKQLQDARELQEAIQEARAVRLALG